MPADLENDLLLITCASGKQAANLLPHIFGKWKRLRLHANSPKSVKRLQETYPSAEVIQADLGDASQAARLLKGVSTIYLVLPTMHEHEDMIGYAMIDAAVAETEHGQFKHFVFSSVAQTQLRKMLHHDIKRYVEEYLMESELPYTILHPTHFMNNFPIADLATQSSPVYHASYSPNPPMAFLSLEEYGEVSALVFAERERHFYAEYQLAATMPMPYTHFVNVASKVLGREIQIEQVPFGEAVDSMLKRVRGGLDVPRGVRDATERIVLYYQRRGMLANPVTLEALLGRKPMGAEEWLRLQLEKGKH